MAKLVRVGCEGNGEKSEQRPPEGLTIGLIFMYLRL